MVESSTCPLTGVHAGAESPDNMHAAGGDPLNAIARPVVPASAALMGSLDCTVCMYPYDINKRQPHILPCGGAHELCSECVESLRKRVPFLCPCCRELIKPEARINVNRGLLAALEERDHLTRHLLRTIHRQGTAQGASMVEVALATNPPVSSCRGRGGRGGRGGGRGGLGGRGASRVGLHAAPPTVTVAPQTVTVAPPTVTVAPPVAEEVRQPSCHNAAPCQRPAMMSDELESFVERCTLAPEAERRETSRHQSCLAVELDGAEEEETSWRPPSSLTEEGSEQAEDEDSSTEAKEAAAKAAKAAKNRKKHEKAKEKKKAEAAKAAIQQEALSAAPPAAPEPSTRQEGFKRGFLLRSSSTDQAVAGTTSSPPCTSPAASAMPLLPATDRPAASAAGLLPATDRPRSRKAPLPSGGAPEGFTSDASRKELIDLSPAQLLEVARMRGTDDVRLAHSAALLIYQRINFVRNPDERSSVDGLGIEWSCDRLGEAGWPRVLAKMMRAHLPPIDPYVVAIQRMAASGALNRSALPDAAAPDLALRLARMCCLALHQLTCSCDDDDVISHRRRRLVAESGALPVIVKAMGVYELAQWRLGQAACMVLYNVCAGGLHTIRQQVTEAGAIEATVSFLSYHSCCSACAKNQCHSCGVPPEDWAKNADFGMRVIVNLCAIQHDKAAETVTVSENVAATAKRALRAKVACVEEGVFDKIEAAYDRKNANVMKMLANVRRVLDQSIQTGARPT